MAPKSRTYLDAFPLFSLTIDASSLVQRAIPNHLAHGNTLQIKR